MIHFKPGKFGRAEQVLVVAVIALTLLVVGISTIPAIADVYEQSTIAWTSWAVRYGYVGAFLAALIGNLTIIIVFPYTIVTLFLAAGGLDPFILGVLTGVGAFLGELSGYILGRWGSHRFKQARPEQYQALERIVNYRPRLVGWLLFVFSALPLPDDVLFIPLGMLRYPIWKLTWPSVIGKTVSGLIITYSGSYVLRPFINQDPTSAGGVLSQIGTLYVVAVAIYAIVKVDWTQTMHRLLKDQPVAAKETIV